LIIEVSFPNELTDFALTSGHLTPSLLLQELQKLQKLPSSVYVSHIKPHYRERIEKELAALGEPRVKIARDGMVISI